MIVAEYFNEYLEHFILMALKYLEIQSINRKKNLFELMEQNYFDSIDLFGLSFFINRYEDDDQESNFAFTV